MTISKQLRQRIIDAITQLRSEAIATTGRSASSAEIVDAVLAYVLAEMAVKT
jgi:hypothetical protein